MAQLGSTGRERSDAARLLLAAARERFAVAATDLLIPEQARLTEWQRLTATGLLTRLIGSLEDAFRASLAASFADNEPVHAALSSAHVPIALPILERAGVLGDSDLGAILVRRVEEHRFWKAHAATGEGDLLHELVRDADAGIGTEAMALVIARSRRFDRFQEPALAHVDLPAELQHRLIWLIAAALRHYLIQHQKLAHVDAAIEAAAQGLIAHHDEGNAPEAAANRLARRLHAAGRLDGALVERMLSEGLLPGFIAGLAVLTGLDHEAVWEVLSDPRGRGPALLLRAGRIDRPAAASILLMLNDRSRLFSGPEGEAAVEQVDLFDTMDVPGAVDILRLWQADPAYRASVARISTRARRGAGAA